MKQKEITSEEVSQQIQKIFEKRGKRALSIAKREILGEKIECEEVRKALTYFMTKYWRDLARPSLMSLVYEAVGGKPDFVISLAVPIILMSGAFDLHDDIIDQSKAKMGKPTVYGMCGKDIALLTGNALLFKGITLLYKACENIPTQKMVAIRNIVKDGFFQLGDAEAMELRLRGRLDISPQKYLGLVEKKAMDIEAYTRISAILGGGTDKQVEDLSKYGRALGILAILVDDWMDMIDSKECLHRIRFECLPYPVIASLNNQTTRPKIQTILKKKRKTAKDAEKILEITRAGGEMKNFVKLLEKYVEEACTLVEDTKTNKEYLQLIVMGLVEPLFGVEFTTRI